MIEGVLRAWGLCEDLHARDPAASAVELEECERRLGHQLPEQLRTLYSAAGSGAYFGGMLMIDSLLPGADGAGSVATSPAYFAGLDWDLPTELLIFGGNGVGDLFGIWLPEAETGPCPVIRHTEDFGDPPFAIAGEDLGAFLRGYSALQLRQEQVDPEDPSLDLVPALDALGVPARLRAEQVPDEVAFLSWASPSIPLDGAYLRSVDEEAIRAFVGRT